MRSESGRSWGQTSRGRGSRWPLQVSLSRTLWTRRAESFLKQRARKLPTPSPKRILPQRPRDFFGPALQGLCAVVLAAKRFLEQRAREIFGRYPCKGFLFHCWAQKLPRAAFWKKLPQGLSCPVLERQRKARSDVMSCRCSATSS